MLIERIIKILADYLDANVSDIEEDTKIFMDYDLEDEDIEAVIEKMNDEFDVEIDFSEFCELESVEDIAEYVESLM